MKRSLLFITLPLASCLVSPSYAQFGGTRNRTGFGTGLPAPQPAPATSQANATLPLGQVVLFSSGVGYFSRTGTVRENAVVDLPVRATQLSDVLKSLVLFDSSGTVAPVSYSIADYLSTRSTTTDLKLSSTSSPGEILRAFQGAQVQLSVLKETPTSRSESTYEGRVISVSTRQTRVDDDTTTTEVATLLTEDGLQTIDLQDVTAIKLLDPALDAKLRASLEKSASQLTQQLDDGMRRVTLRFNGKGQRNARAGYLLEMPSWKTTYRLVLDGKNQPYLQGWAIVENPTDEDWNGVQISLVSGRPVSFIQNLAPPLYITRPVVPPPIPNGSLKPQTFGEGFGGTDADNRLAALEAKATDAPSSFGGGNVNRGGVGGFGGGRPPGLGSRAGGIFSNSGSFSSDELQDAAKELATNGPLVQAQAQGAEKGELFVYAVDAKLSLPHGEAAMVPIVSKNIDGEAITIVDSSGNAGALIPTNGIRLKNTTGQHLQGGAITVYADGIYAGDALITNVSPGESRLIAYALDLDLVARLDKVDQDDSVTAIKSTGGGLLISHKATKTNAYMLRNKSDKPKTVLIQEPLDSSWNLVDAKQLFEKSNDGLRFKVTVPANSSLEYKIGFEQPRQETVAVLDFDFDLLDLYYRRKAISPTLKTALDDILVKKRRLSDLTGQRAAQEKALKAITDDQARIRSNMNSLSRDSALYKTYEAKLAAQETQIEKLMTDIDRLQTAETSAKRDLDTAIQNLKAE